LSVLVIAILPVKVSSMPSAYCSTGSLPLKRLSGSVELHRHRVLHVDETVAVALRRGAETVIV
jgi:hypothetical protein